jgi:hypothetical protein
MAWLWDKTQENGTEDTILSILPLASRVENLMSKIQVSHIPRLKL